MNNTNTTGSKTVKLMKHYVTDGVVKARVSYSFGKLINDDRDCVTLYAKDYTDNLGTIFASDYKNDTDMVTDYFDKGRVRIFSDSPLFAAAVARCRNMGAR